MPIKTAQTKESAAPTVVKRCNVVGCENKHYGKGLCNLHWARMKRLGTTELPEEKKCSIEGCIEKHRGHGLCNMHLSRKRKGAEMDNPPKGKAGSGCITPLGYRLITVNGQRNILEHRWIWEQANGRKLTKDETIHHKNGNRLDNRLENLELWNTQQPAGQRTEDKLQWAKEIIALYERDNDIYEDGMTFWMGELS